MEITPLSMSNDGSSSEEKNEQIVDIGTRTMLFDLNKNLTEFLIYFEVQTENPEDEFMIRVLTQQQLDDASIKNQLQDDQYFKKINGFINGEVKNKSTTYENHFLALRSVKPLRVIIKTVNRNLESTDQQNHSNEDLQNHEVVEKQENFVNDSSLISRIKAVVSSFFVQNRTLCYAIVLVGSGFLGYFIYTKYWSKSSSLSSKKTNNERTVYEKLENGENFITTSPNDDDGSSVYSGSSKVSSSPSVRSIGSEQEEESEFDNEENDDDVLFNTPMSFKKDKLGVKSMNNKDLLARVKEFCNRDQK